METKKGFKDVYTNSVLAEKNKICLSNDFYALCEILDKLLQQLRRRP